MGFSPGVTKRLTAKERFHSFPRLGRFAVCGGVTEIEDLDPTSNRAVAEYLLVLDDAAFGGATPVEPKTISPIDLAARYTASLA